MLRDSTQGLLLEALEEEGIPYKHNRGQNIITLTHPAFRRARILLRSMEVLNRLRGMNLAWYGVDELTYAPEEAWQIMEGRLRQPRANQYVGFAAFTPKGFDWVWSLFADPQRSEQKKALYTLVQASPRENTHLPPEYYDTLAASYDERFFRQEALGEFLSVFSGQVYHAFDRSTHVRPVDYDPRFPVCWSCDFNVSPMCTVIAQVYRPQRFEFLEPELHVIDELVIRDSGNTARMVEMFLTWIRSKYVGRPIEVRLHGDASGRNSKTTGGTDWEVIINRLRSAPEVRYVDYVPEANPLVGERANLMNGLLRNYRGDVRLYVNPRCQGLIRDLERVQWKVHQKSKRSTGEIDKDSDKMISHLSDALGYLAYIEFNESTKLRYGQQVIA